MTNIIEQSIVVSLYNTFVGKLYSKADLPLSVKEYSTLVLNVFFDLLEKKIKIEKVNPRTPFFDGFIYDIDTDLYGTHYNDNVLIIVNKLADPDKFPDVINDCLIDSQIYNGFDLNVYWYNEKEDCYVLLVTIKNGLLFLYDIKLSNLDELVYSVEKHKFMYTIYFVKYFKEIYNKYVNKKETKKWFIENNDFILREIYRFYRLFIPEESLNVFDVFNVIANVPTIYDGLLLSNFYFVDEVSVLKSIFKMLMQTAIYLIVNQQLSDNNVRNVKYAIVDSTVTFKADSFERAINKLYEMLTNELNEKFPYFDIYHIIKYTSLSVDKLPNERNFYRSVVDFSFYTSFIYNAIEYNKLVLSNQDEFLYKLKILDSPKHIVLLKDVEGELTLEESEIIEEEKSLIKLLTFKEGQKVTDFLDEIFNKTILTLKYFNYTYLEVSGTFYTADLNTLPVLVIDIEETELDYDGMELFTSYGNDVVYLLNSNLKPYTGV